MTGVERETSEAGRRLSASRPRVPRTCEVCGRTFTGRETARYCGNACSLRASRGRRAAGPGLAFTAAPLALPGLDPTPWLRAAGFDPAASRLEVLTAPWDGLPAGTVVAVGVDADGDAVVRRLPGA